MTIWVDADSCPKQIRTIVERASNKRMLPCFFVANRLIPIRATDYVQNVQTENADQAADNYIFEHAGEKDLVITRDIPLAKKLIDAKITVINDRGTEFTANDINTRLSERNFMYELANAGLMPEKTHVFNKKDVQNFAANFDRILDLKLKN